MLLLGSGARATGAGREFTAKSGAAMWLPGENRILTKTEGAHLKSGELQELAWTKKKDWSGGGCMPNCFQQVAGGKTIIGPTNALISQGGI